MIEFVLDKNGTRIQTFRDGKLYVRSVDDKEFKNAIVASARFDTGLLPANTRYYRRRGPYVVLAVELPATKRKIKTGYAGSEGNFEGCAMPAGVFFFKLFENKDATYNITRAEIYATKKDGLRGAKTPLSHYPTPNNSTSICWGENSATGLTLKAISAVEGVVVSYFSTRFNSELGLPRVSSKFPKGPQMQGGYGEPGIKEYFEELTKHPHFEDKWLPAPSKRTFESVLNRFLGAAANTEVGEEMEDNGDLDEADE